MAGERRKIVLSGVASLVAVVVLAIGMNNRAESEEVTNKQVTLTEVKQNWETVPLDKVRQAAEQGQTDAMYELYLSYWNGKGVMPDHGAARTWLTKAAEAGNPFAQCVLGHYLEHPDENSYSFTGPDFNDMPAAVQWYRRSAEQNWAGGQYHLGLCYLGGKGVEWDEEKGLELIRKAADQGHSYSLKKLAELYRKGIGEPRSENDRPVNLLKRVKKE